MNNAKSLFDARHVLVMLASILFAGISFAQASSHSTGHGKSAELGTAAVADSNGRLWAVTKEVVADEQFLVLHSSEDMGKTWKAPRRILSKPEPVAARGEARPHIALGTRGEIYISWTKTVARPHIGDIRFMRSLDGGNTFSEPMTVHADRAVVTHSFESMLVDGEGRIYIAWVDGRDQANAKVQGRRYSGSAVYYAVSSDAGASFKGDYKIADHACECCRIGLSLDGKGRPVAMWRHVFEPNIRDHAIAPLPPDGKGIAVTRVTFDDWKVDACPHHGPSIAYGSEGVRHQVWFNGKASEGSGAMYARTTANGALEKPTPLGTAQASHPDVVARDKQVAVVWKQFDGKATNVLARLSEDNGKTWREQVVASTEGDSDKPYLITTTAQPHLLWRTQHGGIGIFPLGKEQR